MASRGTSRSPTAACRASRRRGRSCAHSLRSARCSLDAIVVVRGGGSRNELAVFDAEPIARRDRRDAGAGAHGHRARGRSIDRRSRRPHVAEDADGVRGSSRRASARLTRRAESICDSHRAVCSHRARPQRAEGGPHRRARAARRESRARRRLVQRASVGNPGRAVGVAASSGRGSASRPWRRPAGRSIARARSVPPFATSTASRREWSRSIRRGARRGYSITRDESGAVVRAAGEVARGQPSRHDRWPTVRSRAR